MKFEEAMNVMKHGFKMRLSPWRKSTYIWLDFDAGEMRNSEEPSVEYRFSYDEYRSNDWEVYKEETPLTAHVNIDNTTIRELLEQEMLTRVPKEQGVMYQLEREDETMYKNLEITFKSGETIAYNSGEWDDYAYDGKAVIVKRNGAWVGIYNFDDVFCVELK